MNVNLPIRTSGGSLRNQSSRNYFTSYTPTSASPGNGVPRDTMREFLPVADRLIVGVDFGTTFSGFVLFCPVLSVPSSR